MIVASPTTLVGRGCVGRWLLWVRTSRQSVALSAVELHPEAASRGTKLERGRFPPDLLRSVLRERPVAQCQVQTLLIMNAGIIDCCASLQPSCANGA